MPKQENAVVRKSLLKRIAVIDREIGQKRYPNKERLAKHLDVSEKTIQRDIEFMKYEYDAPIEFDKKHLGFYYTDERFRMNPLTIDASDFLAVAITEKVLNQYKNSPYSKYFKSFFQKLSNIYEGKLSVNIADIDKIMSFYIGPVRYVSEDVMNIAERALRENIRCKMIYNTGWSDKVSERLIDIYHLKNFSGDWYTVGLCHKTNQIKVFAVSRIKEIKLTNQHFDVPDSFDINNYFADSFGIYESKKIYNVKIKVMGDMVRYLKEKKMHSSEKLTELSDGSIILEYKVNDLNEIFFWILSLGRFCEVIQPKELREMVINELNTTIKNYK